MSAAPPRTPHRCSRRLLSLAPLEPRLLLSSSILPVPDHPSLLLNPANHARLIIGATATPAVAPIPTTTTLTSSTPQSAPGITLTLTARVKPSRTSPSPLQGSVEFFSNGSSLGTALVAVGVATLDVTSNATGTQDLYAVFTPSSNYRASTSAHLSLPVNNPSIVDILAVYTPQLLQSAGSRDNILSDFQRSIDQANQAYINSQIPLALRLVALAPTAYNEIKNLSRDLSRLSDLHDKFMDDIPVLRDTLGADLVVLLESDGTHFPNGSTTLGISTGLVETFAFNRDQDAYVVLDEPQAYTYYTLAHEIGHTFGAAHALTDPSPTGATSYSHGYRFTGKDGVQYHDIMAYAPGQVIPYFSNPNITYAGVPIGNTKSADVSRLIREQAPIVADYRTPHPIGSIESTSLAKIIGYAFDPRTPDPISIRIDIDKQTRATFSADIDRPDLTAKLGLPVHGFSYTIPLLKQGTHTISIYAIDPVSNTPILIGTTKITAPTPLFDENYYLTSNPSTATQVAAGTYKSGWDQFQKVGQFQGLNPSLYFDTQYYLSHNPSVATAITKHKYKSAFQHFLIIGQKQGLAASPLFDEQFYLSSNPTIATAVAKHQYASGLEQYLLLGKTAGISPLPAT